MSLPVPTFDNSYARLPEVFFERLSPRVLPDAKLVHLNDAVADLLGLDSAQLRSDAGLRLLSGQAFPKSAAPLAMAYAGHQFGGFSASLGDGRAMLIGEIQCPDGLRRDVQLKGSGRTRFSRGGDGKAGLGSVLREYIVSEAMAALAVPTTRALSIVTTGENIQRNTTERGAILARVAQSHVRVGTFQYFYARDDAGSIRTLMHYVLKRHYPEAYDPALSDQDAALSLIEAVIQRHAELVAHWMSFGFIHGVMNTDNMQIAGETIDYGPCAFMDVFSRSKVFSSIDRNSRYAFGAQPAAAHWNLGRFAETLLPLWGEERDRAIPQLEEKLAAFVPRFWQQSNTRFLKKLGLAGPGQATDRDKITQRIDEVLDLLENHEVDFTCFFRQLSRRAAGGPSEALTELFPTGALGPWLTSWETQRQQWDEETLALSLRDMARANPVRIARNHRVAEAIAAAENGDMSVFHALVEALRDPFDERPEFSKFERPPTPAEVVQKTLCGT